MAPLFLNVKYGNDFIILEVFYVEKIFSNIKSNFINIDYN